MHSPAFGKADFTNCERVREKDQVVVQQSANAAAFLGLEASLVGVSLHAVPGDLHRVVTNYLDAFPIAVRCKVGDPALELDCLVHRPPAGGIVVELERAGSPVDLAPHVDNALQTILAASSLRKLCDESAKLFKELSGYDRVMLYRFNSEGHGQVLSEERESHLESYLGNWYPASYPADRATAIRAQSREGASRCGIPTGAARAAAGNRSHPPSRNEAIGCVLGCFGAGA